MKADIKQRWMDALRSGKYKQGRGYLHKDDSFCCLGVLCDVVATEIDLPVSQAADGEYRYGKEKNTSMLPPEVVAYAGLEHANPILLSYYNDHGTSFENIAKIIEAEL